MQSILESQKQNYLTWISIEQNKVAKYEDNYVTLFRFKTVVLNSREDFEQISTNQLSILSSLEGIKESNMVALRYTDVVNKIIIRKKTEIIHPNYEALLAKISTKLCGYLNSISYSESLIESYKGKIREIEEQIEFFDSVAGEEVGKNDK